MGAKAPTRKIERELWARGFNTIVGIDEVGRGAWAGPLVVGAAIINPTRRIAGVRDSKMLTEPKREALFDKIADWCLDWAVGSVTHLECDELGMADAQRLACRRAVEALQLTPDVAVSDGKWDFVTPLVPQVEMRVKADRDCVSVAAASILAKVSRDRQMRQLADHYPAWSFDTNKGYPCPLHKAALEGYGPSALHRRSWVFIDNYVHWSGVRRYHRSEQPTLF